MFSPRHNSVYSKSALCIYHHQFNTFCHTEYFYKTVLRVQDLMKVSETGLKKKQQKTLVWVKVKNTWLAVHFDSITLITVLMCQWFTQPHFCTISTNVNTVEKANKFLIIMKIVLILWASWKGLVESTVHNSRSAVIQGDWI